MKRLLILIPLLFLGCENAPQEPAVVASTESKIQNNTFSRDIQCNEFGVAYYVMAVKGEDVVTPVLYADHHYNPPQVRNITCKEYIERNSSL